MSNPVAARIVRRRLQGIRPRYIGPLFAGSVVQRVEEHAGILRPIPGTHIVPTHIVIDRLRKRMGGLGEF